jgi:hydrogenase expression/formation protein HypD
MNASAVAERARAEQLFAEIAAMVSGPTYLMEVCGTHTVAIGRSGLRSRMPPDLHLVSGPGCPVCVTPAERIDRLIRIAREPGVAIATFGDMIRVPGSDSTLERERAEGRDVRVVHSVATALEMAITEPATLVVFFGIGFETTSPSVAATLERALVARVPNFFVLPAFKVVPPAMDVLASGDDTRLDGFLCPGHVSTIIGSAAYEPIARDRKVPCVVAGFEAVEILEAVRMLLRQKIEGRADVEVQYARAVSREGNEVARGFLSRVFRPCDAMWRGIGRIPDSGLDLAPEFQGMDAAERIPVEVPQVPDLPRGCACGAVMKGKIIPPDCALFGKSCVPLNPVGPCMVSSEGACAAYYKYEVMSR